MSKYRLTDVEWMLDPSCPIERVGGEWLVIRELNGTQSRVLRLSAASAEVVSKLRRGPAPLPEYLLDAASELEVWGVVHPARTDPGLYIGRRQFIRMGAGGAAVGIAVLSLPNAAAAASAQQKAAGGEIETFTTAENVCYQSHTFRYSVDEQLFDVLVEGLVVDYLIVGAGGGGGAGRTYSAAGGRGGGGGGGGGGQVVTGTTTLSATAPGFGLAIVPGLGGNSPSDGTGGDGGSGALTEALGLEAQGGAGGIGAGTTTSGTASSRNGGDSGGLNASGTMAGGAGFTSSAADPRNRSGGGGGGAASAGGNASSSLGGSGGAAYTYLANEWALEGASLAGGGAGGGVTAGTAPASGGSGGYATGNVITGQAVGAQAGSNGGGGGGSFGTAATARGASGLVIIRYPNPGACAV